MWTDYLTKDEPDLGLQARRRRQVARQDGRLADRYRRQGQRGRLRRWSNQTEGAIGYVELQYALAQQADRTARSRTRPASSSSRASRTITAAANGVLPAGPATCLTDGAGLADAYPITGTTYALVYQNQTDTAKAAALVNFLSWVLTTGQDTPSTINYAPLGADLQKLAIGQVKKITLNGKPLVK